MLKRTLLFIGLVLAAYVVWFVASIAYGIYANSGPLNSSGDQPPTACTVAKVELDCEKLNCVSRVWYCDQRGKPTCYEGKCVCAYGCL
jgi:hypothetical protein